MFQPVRKPYQKPFEGVDGVFHANEAVRDIPISGGRDGTRPLF